MIYTKFTKKAIKLAFERHKNQYDKSDIPYILHPIHVAEQMNDEDTTIVALLHDIIEDTETSIEELKIYGFSDKVLQAINVLTHDKSIEYETYIKNIAKNPIALKVKIADLEHNSDLTRLSNVAQKDIERVEKYRQSLIYLKNYYEKHYK